MALERSLIRLQCYEGIEAARPSTSGTTPGRCSDPRHRRAPGGTTANGQRAVRPGFLVERPLLAAVSRRRRGPAGGRGRPGGRRVRGVPARNPVRLPDHHPRARHGRRRAAAAGGADLQPHPGAARRAQAPLRLPLGRLSRRRARSRDRGLARPGQPGAGPQGRRGGQPAAPLDLAKAPGVAETIDWVRSLGVLGADDLDPDAAADTIGAVVKDATTWSR